MRNLFYFFTLLPLTVLAMEYWARESLARNALMESAPWQMARIRFALSDYINNRQTSKKVLESIRNILYYLGQNGDARKEALYHEYDLESQRTRKEWSISIVDVGENRQDFVVLQKMGLTPADLLSSSGIRFRGEPVNFNNPKGRTQEIINAITEVHGNFVDAANKSHALTAMIKNKCHVKAVQMVLEAGVSPEVDSGVDIDEVYKPVIDKAKDLYDRAYKLNKGAVKLKKTKMDLANITDNIKQIWHGRVFDIDILGGMSIQDVYMELQKDPESIQAKAKPMRVWSEVRSFLKMGVTPADVLSKFTLAAFDFKGTPNEFNDRAEAHVQEAINAIKDRFGNFAHAANESHAITAMIKANRHVKAVQMVLEAGAYPIIADPEVHVDGVYKSVIAKAKDALRRAIKLPEEVIKFQQAKHDLDYIREKMEKIRGDWEFNIDDLEGMSRLDIYIKLQKDLSS